MSFVILLFHRTKIQKLCRLKLYSIVYRDYLTNSLWRCFIEPWNDRRMRRGRHYLRKICAVALSANPSIKFAAVLDEKGRLIVAECKSNTNTNNFGRRVTNMNYLLHQNYILPSLRERYNKNLKVMRWEWYWDRIQNGSRWLEHWGCNNSISRNKRVVFMCVL